MEFTGKNRHHFIKKASKEKFDVIVIGGGITGCGIALDAALRGLKTLLVEKDDFASGTSSRSTKLIHGGLRYLKQMEFKLVRDVGRERAIVYKNAMHVVKPERMLLPIITNGSLGKITTSMALSVYDFLADVDDDEKKRMLNAAETLQREPLLNKELVEGGALYYEYRSDDARLVIELAKSSYKEGAVLLNYCSAEEFIYSSEGKVVGVKLKDQLTENIFDCSGSYVINATGPWVDELRKSDNSLKGKRLVLTKGVHIVLPHLLLPIKQAVYFDTQDGRMIFAIPRNEQVYVGTTDTFYEGQKEEPGVTLQDVEYLLNAIKTMFPSKDLKMSDVVSSWSGLRPLIYEEGKDPSELSRKDEIMESPSGLLSIAGGKLTGYRLMAEKIVDLIFEKSKRTPVKSTTKTYKLSGCVFQNGKHMSEYLDMLIENHSDKKWMKSYIVKWFYRYGVNASMLIDNAIALEKVIDDEAYRCLMAELIYTFEHEMVVTIADFMVRRSGMMYFERKKGLEYFENLHDYLKTNMHYTIEQNERYIAECESLFRQAVSFN